MNQLGKKKPPRAFRRSVLQGLGVVAPPLLTIVILVWVFNTVQVYVLSPIENSTNYLISWVIDDTMEEVPAEAVRTDGQPEFVYEGARYVQIADGNWLPAKVVEQVNKRPGPKLPSTSQGYYLRYSEITFLSRFVVPPVFFLAFILLLYFVGSFLAYGVGRVIYRATEQIITQLPIIRSVYSSVKQVTDFVFTQSEFDFNRVVAVEYPRKGIWSLGFVTGESMLDIRNKAAEPVISVLMPTSPMPATGFTITVRKSETVELDISIDQAFQFILSCGVVVPLPQRQDEMTDQIREAIENNIISHA